MRDDQEDLGSGSRGRGWLIASGLSPGLRPAETVAGPIPLRRPAAVAAVLPTFTEGRVCGATACCGRAARGHRHHVADRYGAAVAQPCRAERDTASVAAYFDDRADAHSVDSAGDVMLRLRAPYVVRVERHRHEGPPATVGGEPGAWAVRNCFQLGPDRLGAGSTPALWRIFHTVLAAMR